MKKRLFQIKYNINTFIYSKIIDIWLFYARKRPLMNKVVFCNHFGKGFGDDPKYIALALLRQKTKAKLYWMTTDLSIDLPEGIIPILYGSSLAKYHLHTAKVWVFNFKNSFKVQKREGQFYVQTWHGSFANKKVEKDTVDTLSFDYLRETQWDSSMIDLMYSNNDFKINLFKSSFFYSGSVIKSDSPQLSILFHTPEDLKNKICCIFNVNPLTKIAIYAPTFRNNTNMDFLKFDYEKVIDALECRFGGEFVLFLRLHPNYSSHNIEISHSKKVVFATDYPDMDELIAVSDVMISDYSGVMYDMAIKCSPVFMIAKDYDLYLSKERECYFPYECLPFKIARDEDQLVANILCFNMDEYLNNVEAFFEKIGLEEHGNGANNIANVIVEKIEQ